jgi:hypothetical protein
MYGGETMMRKKTRRTVLRLKHKSKRMVKKCDLNNEVGEGEGGWVGS